MEVNSKLSPRAKEDYRLVVEAREHGNQHAFAQLLERYRSSVYYTIIKIVNNPDDAEDMTIEAFGKAFHNINKYTSDYAFSTWLFKIAVNNAIDFMRKKRITTHSLNSTDSSDPDTVYRTFNIKATILDPEEKFIHDQRAEILKEIVDTLHPRYKQLIKLRFFEELSYEEIAEKLSLPIGTVKNQLFRAKDLLYEILKEKSESY
jgi:RNA polymerase sigma factor (sigma-70 family)